MCWARGTVAEHVDPLLDGLRVEGLGGMTGELCPVLPSLVREGEQVANSIDKGATLVVGEEVRL